MNYGRNVIGSTGIPIEVAASGPPEWMPGGGVTVDWSTITAPGSDTVSSPAEQLKIPAGRKFLRYGQVIARITSQPAWTATVTGTPTGGTYQLAGYRPDTGAFVISQPIAYNANAAAVLAAFNAQVGGPGFSGVPIAVTGSGPYTITTMIQNLQLYSNALTGGTSPSVTVANSTVVGNTGLYGPYDSTATDGRQTLTPGQCGIINTTTLQGAIMGIPQMATDHPGTIVGGVVWQNRIIATSGTHSLAAGPTWAELIAALPRLQFAGSGPLY